MTNELYEGVLEVPLLQVVRAAKDTRETSL
jgi:hypothetical protein